MVDIIDIIERLDREGIHLQETILNLENQGYEEYWNYWLKSIYDKAMMNYQLSLARKELKKVGLI